MTASINRLALAFVMLALFASPLTGEVFAQPTDLAATSTEREATSTADVASVAEDSWFMKERISGKIDVGDFVVGPGRSEIDVQPGQTVVQLISVTNRISDNRIFRLEVEDIVGSADGSDAVSLTGDAAGPYSIRDYISFPEEEFKLALGERARIPVTITVPPNAEPGGYYGSVLVSTVQESVTEQKNVPRSPVIARVGSLIFLTVQGDTFIEGETIDLQLVDKKWWYESGPINLGILYENRGNTHLDAAGQLSITNLFGEEVGYLELEPWFILPKSLRLREVTWDREFLLGRYKATAQIDRGYDGIVDEVSVAFWVLPWRIVGGVFLVLFIVIFSIRAFFRTFEFKRKSA